MCLFSIRQIPKEEHFQSIRYKLCRQDSEYTFFPPFRFSVRFERGKLYFDQEDGIIKTSLGLKYRKGFHVLQDSSYPHTLVNEVLLPVLISDIVAYGADENSFFGTTIVARIIYFLTDKEVEFLTSDKKPILISEDSLSLAESEV